MPFTKADESGAPIPDPGLHGNGINCPACELRRERLVADAAMDQSVACNFCGGTGRVGRAVAEIVREAVEWAARHYWPERIARWGEADS
jgi:hypothetical protein